MYYKARKIALNNNHSHHIVAFIKQRSGFVFGTNGDKCSAKFARVYPDGSIGYHLHAEMDLINKFAAGTIEQVSVIRFKKNGEITMAKPCIYCQRFLKRHGVKKVRYTNWDGRWNRMIIN